MEGRGKGKENHPRELGLLFLTQLGLGNSWSPTGNLVSPEDDSVLLAKEWVYISADIKRAGPDRGQSASGSACHLLSFTGGVRCSAFKRTGFSAVFLPLRVYRESSVLYINQSFHDLLWMVFEMCLGVWWMNYAQSVLYYLLLRSLPIWDTGWN